MVGRGVVVVVLSIVLFAVVSLVTGLVALWVSGSFERAALNGGVCGFAAAWLTNTIYFVGRHTGGTNDDRPSSR
jgi:hypothetical protein